MLLSQQCTKVHHSMIVRLILESGDALRGTGVRRSRWPDEALSGSVESSFPLLRPFMSNLDVELDDGNLRCR